MLTSIALLFGAICTFVIFKAYSADHVQKVLLYWSAALVAIPVVVSVLMMALDPPIGDANDAGIFMKSWGVARIAWGDIESFSVDDPGEGGPIVSFYLHNEEHYLSQASLGPRQAAWLRQGSRYGTFVIYAGNVNQPLDKLVAEIGRRVKVRARVA